MSAPKQVRSPSPTTASTAATPSVPSQLEQRKPISSPHIPIPTPMKDRQSSMGSEHSHSLRPSHPMVSISPPSQRKGSRSPSSIPPSPTSVHSSSSAIFERDIEPLAISPAHYTNPHRIPRAKATEPIDLSVPSVLDSAATMLASSDDVEDNLISVEAPVRSASRAASALGSPIGPASRSPSPTRSPVSRASILLNLPSPPSSTVPNSLSSGTLSGPPLRPTVHTIFGGQFTAEPPAHQQQIVPPPDAMTPTSIASAPFISAQSSPLTTTTEHTIQPLPPLPLPSPPASILPLAQQLSHPPSPASKRLSFISYNDLLACTPTSTLPLSSLTTPADPPPHLPSLSIGFPATNGSRCGSAAASMFDGYVGGDFAIGDVRDIRRNILDDGGEWQREGLGRGLEERLDALKTFETRA